jgi:putative hydrolases of HD superfamily
MNDARLQKQIDFIVELDRLKQVYRQSFLIDGSRRENDVEHSWHIAMMAVLLSEYAEEGVDLLRAVKMLLIHDIVEIEAGDVFVYDAVGNSGKLDRERSAADTLFNILPPDQAAEIRALWDEYEERKTPEARFAFSLDRLQPILQNYHTQGKSWKAHGVTAKQVLSVNARINDGSPVLWEYTQRIIQDSVEKGYLKP